jgi:hypothetical protein
MAFKRAAAGFSNNGSMKINLFKPKNRDLNPGDFDDFY